MIRYCFLLFCLVCATASGQRNATLDSLLLAHQNAVSGRGGGVTMILMRNDQELYNRSLGDFSPEKSVPIASASKWYSGVLLMLLVHDKVVSLDDRVSRYIPSFRTQEKQAITLRQCFSMSAGFGGTSEDLDDYLSNRSWTYAQLVDSIAQRPLGAAPGTQLIYNGLGMQVAGRVCELATGKSWHELFEERVARPLGLKHTYYAGYYTGAVPRIAGGVISCASDYLKLLSLLAKGGVWEGKTLLSATEVDLMLADQTVNCTVGYSPFTKFKQPLGIRTDAHYAIGNWVIREPGALVNTSPGAFGFTPWIDRKRGYYGVIAVRSAFPKVMPFFWKVLGAMKDS